MTAPTPQRFELMCAALHGLAQESDATPGPARGANWERRIERDLLLRGFPIRTLVVGAPLLGAFAASGLRHQVDAEIRCERAFVIGEWKAFTGTVPKNEILRFKAVTDDYYDGMAPGTRRASIMRVFGISGDGSLELRRYAARHAICLVERSRWPAPVLADPLLPWPARAPSEADRRRLAWLSRPMQEVLRPQADGTMLMAQSLSPGAIDALLRLQDRWSSRLDEQLVDRADPYSRERRSVA